MIIDMHTSTHLNVLPLGAHSMLLGMDWLFIHMTKVDCYEKAIGFLCDDGGKRVLQRKKKPTSVRMVIVIQAKHSHRNAFVLFVVHVSSNKGKEYEDDEVLRKYLVSWQFHHVFIVEILELLPQREVDFSIDLIPTAAPTSKALYKRSTPELVELKLQLK